MFLPNYPVVKVRRMIFRECPIWLYHSLKLSNDVWFYWVEDKILNMTWDSPQPFISSSRLPTHLTTCFFLPSLHYVLKLISPFLLCFSFNQSIKLRYTLLFLCHGMCHAVIRRTELEWNQFSFYISTFFFFLHFKTFSLWF